MAQVKILWFVEANTNAIEHQIEEMIDDGWRIVAAGGGGDAPEEIEGRQVMFRPLGIGFIVMQRDAPRRAASEDDDEEANRPQED